MTATMYNGTLDEVLPARFKDGSDYYKLVVIKDPIPNPNVIEVEPPPQYVYNDPVFNLLLMLQAECP